MILTACGKYLHIACDLLRALAIHHLGAKRSQKAQDTRPRQMTGARTLLLTIGASLQNAIASVNTLTTYKMAQRCCSPLCIRRKARWLTCR